MTDHLLWPCLDVRLDIEKNLLSILSSCNSCRLTNLIQTPSYIYLVCNLYQNFFLLQMERPVRNAKLIANRNLFANTIILGDSSESDGESDQESGSSLQREDEVPDIEDPERVPQTSHSSDSSHNRIKRNFRWRTNRSSPVGNVTCNFKMQEPPDVEKSLFEYFRLFFPTWIIEKLADETNAYSVQKSGRCIDVTNAEIEQFLAIYMHSAIMYASNYRMYWQSATRYPTIADIITLKRFETIKQFFHLNDNVHQPKKGEEGYN